MSKLPVLAAGFFLFASASWAGSDPVRVTRVAGWSDQSYYIGMPDGVRLAASVWFPGGQVPSAEVPVVLIQTRYGRAGVFNYGENGQYRRYLNAGFAVAVVDTRGTTSSFGSRVVEIGPDEVKDMDTLIAHFRTQPWANGEVFATGVSYMADTADIATASPVGINGAIVRESDFDAYLDLFSPGGVANEAMMNIWGGDTLLRDYGKSSDPKQDLNCALRAEDCAKLWPRLQPVDADEDYRLLQAAIASRAKHWQPDDYRSAEFRDDKAANGFTEFSSGPAAYLKSMEKRKVPTQYWGSWMDAGTADAALARFRSLPDVPMQVWITANTHINDRLTDPFFPDESAPRPSIDEQWRTMLDFLHRVRQRGAIGRLIHYYVLGAGTFATSTEWPPRDAKPIRWYFTAGHALSRSAPARAGEDSQQVDAMATSGAATRWTTQMGTPAAYADRRDADSKLLTYTSELFANDTELVGSPSLTLYVSSNSSDPEFFAYLEDVAPDGRVTYVTEGLFKAVNRKPAARSGLPYAQSEPAKSYLRRDAQAMPVNQSVKIEFPIFPVAALIRQGHSLRVSLAGADRSAFRHTGPKDERWSVRRSPREASVLRVTARPWRAPE